MRAGTWLLFLAAAGGLLGCAAGRQWGGGSPVAATVHGYDPLGRARAALETALVNRDRTAAVAARLRLGEALLEAGSLEEARFHLIQVKEAGTAAQRLRARALLAWSYAAAGRPTLARAYLAGLDPARLPPDLRDRLAPFSGRTSVAPAGSAPALDLGIRPRASWHAASTRTALTRPMEPVRRITIHHSGTHDGGGTAAAVAAALRAIQREHFHRGWADIGYHYVIDRAGRIWEGRPLQYQGAHAGNGELNRGNLGVCLLGDFDREEATAAQLAALRRLLDTLRRRYGLGPEAVVPHGALRPTACPGWRLRAWVEAYRRGPAPRWHRVAPGETLAAIARRYGVPLAALRAVNPGKGDHLRAGEWVVLP